MKIFDLDSPLMNVLNKMADLMWLNILTLICCIPVITAGAALTSMHYVALKIVRNEESYITRSFFKSFKTNFRQATLIWLLLMLVAAILGGDYYIITKSGMQFSQVLVVLIMAAGVLVICTSLYVFPVLAKFDNTILNTIKNAFFMAEQERMLSYHDFLWTQLRVIQKRWWVLQFMILVALWIALSSIHDEIYLKRSMGVVATLFVILIIPELWKNRSCECMEIEAASYYSLKQVYATRMLLFGITDIFFITVFLGVASAGLHYELSELVVQFLFPLCVTACICFGILCSKHAFSETVAIVLCVIWSAVWLFIVLNENVYIMVTVPIWSALLGVTILFIAFAIYRILKNCNQYLEVSFDEIRA